jgi:hypothetical protein
MNAIHGSRLTSAAQAEWLEVLLARVPKLDIRYRFTGPNSLPRRNAPISFTKPPRRDFITTAIGVG